MAIQSINPASEQLLQEYTGQSDQSAVNVIHNAWRGFVEWRDSQLENRSRLLTDLAAELRKRQQHLAELMTAEMGKPISQSQSEIEKCAGVCDFYATHAAQFLAADPIATQASRSYVRYDPLGPVLAIMPWNFPFWQVFRFAAPAVMAGNVVILKHASNVTGCALEIEQLFRKAGSPEGVFQTLIVSSQQIPAILTHQEIRAVTLTGSEAAGRSVAEAAGRNLRKCVLELGGSDPFIVLEDADIDSTAAAAADARTINSGQSCIAAKRFLIADRVYEQFAEAMTAHMSALKTGDPQSPETQIGPLARADLRHDLHTQVQRSIQQDAVLTCGGAPPGGPGFYYPPTVLTNVVPGVPAFDEELFGPVAALIRCRNDTHAVELANLSRFGLGASIWTADIQRAERMAATIESGAVFINEITKSDVHMPFGGVKDSGYGRELGSFGIREFTNVKSVWIR